MELFKASSQWSTRPSDERFWSDEEMFATCKKYAQQARVKVLPWDQIVVSDKEGEVIISGPQGIPARMTHYGFGQLAQKTQAPAQFLRELPAKLAAECLSDRLVSRKTGNANLLFHQENGGYLCRGISSDIYERFWNWEVLERLQALKDLGWRTPPARPIAGETRARPATVSDVFPGTSIQIGEMIGPAGLYASDHDMFVFKVHPNCQVVAGSQRTLSKGFFLWNAEVAGVSLGVTMFLYDHVCGNHIIWGAENVKEVRLRHIGQIRERFPKVRIELREWADESVSDLEAKIRVVRSKEIAASKEEVLDTLFGMKAASRKQLEQSYTLAERLDDENPRTYWGFVQGMTRLSQQVPYADERVTLERAAGKVLEAAF